MMESPFSHLGLGLPLAALLLTAASLPAQAWTQAGQDIDGEAAFDESGWSVALSVDGSRVAIGAYHNDGTDTDAGHVRVYDWTGSAWIQVGQDIDGEARADQSGWSVALSADGSRVAIGARYNSGSGRLAGHVRVYDWSGSAWTQAGQDIDGEAAGDESGYSVALAADGRRLAIGAPRNSGTGTLAGQVRVYDWSGSSWSQVGQDIDGEAASDQSGYSVALAADGRRVAIGAPGNDGTGASAGHVRLYDWNGSSWTQVGQDIDGEAAGDLSGGAVALASAGSRVAIGARWNDGSGTDAGHVRLYDWNGSAWTQVGQDIDGEAPVDQSGAAVALAADGSRVAIGAAGNDGTGTIAGHVRVYGWNGSAWTQVGQDIDGEAAEDLSGFSVALAADGSRVAIGAPLNDGVIFPGANVGHVRVYDCTAQPNDECANALPIAAGMNGPFDNLCATDSSPAMPCGGTASNDVWFVYRHFGWNATVEVDTCTGTGYDSKIEVLSGGCAGLTSIACNDDRCGLQSGVSWSASRGTTYYVRVGGNSGARGTFNLELRIQGAFSTIAPGCGGVTLVGSGIPAIGSNITVTMGGTSGLAQVIWLGPPGGTPITYCAGCVQRCDQAFLFGVGAAQTIGIPNDPVFCGACVCFQGADVGNAGGCDFGFIRFALSGVLQVLIGC